MPPAVTVLFVVLVAIALAIVTYGGVERLLPGAWLPALCRSTAWAALGLLLLNPGCPVPGQLPRALVLLDGSVSLAARGGGWDEARRTALALGDVRLFGDPGVALDSVPAAGRSLLAPALEAALATGRHVIVVTDGEIEDASALSPAALRVAGVRLFPRAAGPAAAVRSVTGPARVTGRDTVRLRVELATMGLPDARDVGLVARSGEAILLSVRVQLPPSGSVAAELVLPPGRLGAGDHVLAVGLADSVDAERRDDQRLHLVVVSPTPGLVVAASPGDWEARFLYQTLRDVSSLPVEGYVELERGRWRRFSDLSPVSLETVRRAVARADLAVLRGAEALRTEPSGRAVLVWPGPEGAEEGDWYLAVGGGPVAPGLAGTPVDSFPPAVALRSLVPEEGDWVGLTAQAGRRGAARPALVGGIRDGRRHVTVGAEGLWRWAFRGGTPEQGYRALIAGVVDWLLAAPDTVRGVAVPVRSVVPLGAPLVFLRTGGAPREPVPIRFQDAAGGTREDTLVWDGSGRAHLRLDPGVYTYALAGGGRGTVAVEAWSEEWFPRPVILDESEGAVAAGARSRGMRDRLWLFGLLVGALSAEWFLRRRRGLR